MYFCRLKNEDVGTVCTPSLLMGPIAQLVRAADS